MKVQEIPMKIVLLGDNSIQKVSLYLSYFGRGLDYAPTVFDNYSALLKIDDKLVNLSLWDTAGAQQYNRLRPLAYPKSDIFIIAFSICERSSFVNALKKWYTQIIQSVQQNNSSIMFVGLYSQLRKLSQDKKSLDLVDQKQAKQTIEQLKCRYMECSPRTRENVQDVILECVRMGLKKKEVRVVKKKQNKKCQLI